MICWLAADESCWLLGELVVQYNMLAAADKRCWLLGELVVQYKLRRDASYNRIGWLLMRAAGCWLIVGRDCWENFLIRGEQVVRGVNQSGRIAQERLRGQQRRTCLRGVLPRGFMGSLERGEDEDRTCRRVCFRELLS
jgi:hypothetical protein